MYHITSLIRILATAFVVGVFFSQLNGALSQTASVKTVHTFHHDHPVTGLAWSPDGHELVTMGFLSKPITVWDTRTGMQIRQINRSAGYGPAAAFSSDGHYLITSASAENLGAGLTLWDTETWTVSRHIHGLYDGMAANYSAARLISLSSNGKKLAYSALGGPGAPIGLVNAKTWMFESNIPGTRLSVVSLSLAPDGKTLAVGTLRGQLDFILTATNQTIQSIAPYQGFAVGVGAISYSADGQLLATGSLKPVSNNPSPPDPVRVMRTTDGSLVASLSGTFGAVQSLDWSPNGQFVAVAAEDGRVMLWHVATNASRIVTTFTTAAFAVRFSPNGKALASAGRNLAIVSELQ